MCRYHMCMCTYEYSEAQMCSFSFSTLVPRWSNDMYKDIQRYSKKFCYWKLDLRQYIQ